MGLHTTNFRQWTRLLLLLLLLLVVAGLLAGCSRSSEAGSRVSKPLGAPTVSSSTPLHHRARQWLEPEGVVFWNRNDGLLVETVATTPCWSGSSTCPGGEIESTSDGGRRWKAVERVRFPLRAVAVVGDGAAWVETGRCSAASADACATRLLLVSTDGGRRWRMVDSNEPVTSNPSGNPSGPDQLAITRDNGRRWRTRPSPCTRSHGLGTWAVDFASSRHGWLLCTGEPATDMQAKALYQTTDGGRTWQLEAASLSPNDGKVPPAAGGLDLIGTLPGFDLTGGSGGWIWADRHGLLGTRTEGRSWSEIAADVVSGNENEVRAGSLLRDGVGFLLIDHPLHADRCGRQGCGPELLGTTDGGLRWRTLRTWPSR